MKGNPQVINALNLILTKELTAINQYFLHARILQHWGLKKVGEKEYKLSIGEMKNADSIIKRILFLEGIPNLQKYEKISIGTNIMEILSNDMALELALTKTIREKILLMEKEKDFITRELLTHDLEEGEEHMDWLETQMELLQKVGTENYLQSQMETE